MDTGINAQNPHQDPHGSIPTLVRWAANDQLINTELSDTLCDLLHDVKGFFKTLKTRGPAKDALSQLRKRILYVENRYLDPVIAGVNSDLQNRLYEDALSLNRIVFERYKELTRTLFTKYMFDQQVQESGSFEYTNGLARWISHQCEGLSIITVNTLIRNNFDLRLGGRDLFYGEYKELSEVQKSQKIVPVLDLCNAIFHHCIKYQCWDYLTRVDKKSGDILQTMEDQAFTNATATSTNTMIEIHQVTDAIGANMPTASPKMCALLNLPLARMMDSDDYILFLNSPVIKKRGLPKGARVNQLKEYALSGKRTSENAQCIESNRYLMEVLQLRSPNENLADQLINQLPFFFKELAYIKYVPSPLGSLAILSDTGAVLLLESQNILDSTTEAINQFWVNQARAHHSIEHRFGRWKLEGYYSARMARAYFMVTTVDMAEETKGLKSFHPWIHCTLAHGAQLEETCLGVELFNQMAFDLYKLLWAVFGPSSPTYAEGALPKMNEWAAKFKIPVSLHDPSIIYNEGVEQYDVYNLQGGNTMSEAPMKAYSPARPSWMDHEYSSIYWPN